MFQDIIMSDMKKDKRLLELLAGTTVCIYATKTIENLGIEPGKYHITSQDGSVYKTDILTHIKLNK